MTGWVSGKGWKNTHGAGGKDGRLSASRDGGAGREGHRRARDTRTIATATCAHE